jgi:hypothetical protein
MCQVMNGHPGHIGCDLSDEMADFISHKQKLVAEEFLLVERCVQAGVYKYILPEPGLTKIKRRYRHCVPNPFGRLILRSWKPHGVSRSMVLLSTLPDQRSSAFLGADGGRFAP